MTEHYLRIDPSGELSWIPIDRVPYSWTDGDGPSLDQIHSAIGCSCIEQVHTFIPGVVIIVDESGKIKDPPQPYNHVASPLYPGYQYGDWIAGPVILCNLEPVPPLMEMDLFPLAPSQLARLSLFLGIEIPDLDC